MSFCVTVPSEELGAAEDRLAQLGGPRELGAPSGERAARIDRAARVRLAPTADGIEIFERETRRVHRQVAARADRVLAMPLEPLAHRARRLAGDVVHRAQARSPAAGSAAS